MRNARTVLCTASALLLSATLAAPAHAMVVQDWWHKMFPPVDSGPKPEDTLVAPFADQNEAQPKKPDDLYADPGASEMDLSQPHRQQAELAEWLSHTIPDIFAVDPDQLDHHYKVLATGMDPNALAQYQAFLASSNILKTLTDDHLVMHAFVEEQPVVINAMPLDGRYRWLFEAPVTLTFLPTGAKSYQDNGGVTPVNQHIIARIQIGRVPHGQGLDEIEIETLEVRENTPAPGQASSSQASSQAAAPAAPPPQQ